ncbi:energy transducer TonB [Winogradskyella aquimaris]|uniref:Energy transducer TonB n=1 Tax=Winogradskyella aquimaris TaxID=864074 RepID=A0ABU5EMV8_9FLAO|nr:energy transducer TonB [Winogradskyella aquimaris]MDY2587389.1 energy transducer TonB [Winogradskyella aquimaris]
MRQTIILIVYLFSIQFLLAQDKPDGPYQNFYDTGELFVVGQYKNDERVGEWKQYYKNGQVSRIYSYTDGELNKEEINFYDTGIVSKKIVKVDEDFIVYGYYESGELEYERQLTSGYYKGFYEDGGLEIEANYFEDELAGKWKLYNEDGKLEWIVTYEDGYRNGPYEQFYSNGKLKVEGTILKEKKQGIEMRYDENQTLIWKGYYNNDKFSDIWIRYDENGEKVEKIKIKDDPSILNLEATKVPDGVIQKVPVYPGCEVVFGNKARKKCINEGVSKFIGAKFNTTLASRLGLYGRQRIILNFKIDKEGKVTDAKARAYHPGLVEEAIRVINLLPTVKPGEQRGEPVTIPFSIPIIFVVE